MVIGADGSQLGVMSKNDALQIAYDDDLDLLCVAPNAQPPVCKILDYGKYRFEAQKKAKEAKKNQQVTEIKGLRLSPVIDTNDFNTKLKQATKWLEAGNKVKIDMRFRGRMMTRQEVGLKIMNEFIEKTSEISSVDKTPKLEGNIMSCVLTPKKK
jgi:translation initiation factor IF-3